MNSKILQEKLRAIAADDEEIEMRLLKRNEKNFEMEKSAISTSQSTVSLKHYDQVSSYLNLEAYR